VAADAAVIGWTDLPGLAPGATYYTADWSVAFASLVEGTTNYVSVRSWDVAGTTAVLVSAFHVVKDTGGPTVGITLPASGGFRSSLGTISGTAADPVGLKGTEVSIQDLTNLPFNYWNGSGFSGMASPSTRTRWVSTF
jgi:hypothetical protein